MNDVVDVITTFVSYQYKQCSFEFEINLWYFDALFKCFCFKNDVHWFYFQRSHWKQWLVLHVWLMNQQGNKACRSVWELLINNVAITTCDALAVNVSRRWRKRRDFCLLLSPHHIWLNRHLAKLSTCKANNATASIWLALVCSVCWRLSLSLSYSEKAGHGPPSPGLSLKASAFFLIQFNSVLISAYCCHSFALVNWSSAAQGCDPFSISHTIHVCCWVRSYRRK